MRSKENNQNQDTQDKRMIRMLKTFINKSKNMLLGQSMSDESTKDFLYADNLG
jgi:hypothetical protein